MLVNICRHSVGALAALLILPLAGCIIAPKVTSSFPPVPLTTPIHSIALDPQGGILSDAIGIELIKHGFEIVDPARFTNLLVRLNLAEVEVSEPKNLVRLGSEGIDAVLSVDSGPGYDGRPSTASVRVSATVSGQVVRGVIWDNGRAGELRSPADLDARVGVSEAAHQIADALAEGLKRRKPSVAESALTSQVCADACITRQGAFGAGDIFTASKDAP